MIDVGVEELIIKKAGAWYTYDGEQLGQGKEKARLFLKENPEVAQKIEKEVKDKLGFNTPSPLAVVPDVDDTAAGA